VLNGDTESRPLTVVPVTLAKGLEFDQVIVVEPARFASGEARGLHRLYVALTRPGSAAVIAADDQVAALSAILDRAGLEHAVLNGATERRPLTEVPVTLAKGLEFDQVIVVEPARIAEGETRGLHRLYVALTRAVSRLTVLHAEPLPAPLTSPSARRR
jgi:DNA helicase IV